LGQKALANGEAGAALAEFEQAMRPPKNLGEAYHLLQAKADVNYWSGKALCALGRDEEALALFESSASESGDFRSMAVKEHSKLSYYRGLSLIELGRTDQAEALFNDMRAYAKRELNRQPTIDYFATSLPLLLVFEQDIAEVTHRNAKELIQLAEQGLAFIK